MSLFQDQVQSNSSQLLRLALEKQMKALCVQVRQSQIPEQYLTSDMPEYGEIFISNQQNTKGALQSIPESKGKLIRSISGGHRKIFLFQEPDNLNTQESNQQDNNNVSQQQQEKTLSNQHVITALHSQQEDFILYKDQTTKPIDEIVLSLEGNKLKSIASGKQHNIVLTEQGQVFSYGKNNFGSLGLGGKVFQDTPQLISKLNTHKIVKIACGFYHTLALSNIGDVFSWGRGFQGQLGLSPSIQCTASPQFLKHFYRYSNQGQIKMLRKNPIHFIACGASHSMAIDAKGALYCWGEARFGQTGNGKKTKQPVPTQVPLQINGQRQKVQLVAGGLGHTLCLTTNGKLFSWGLNIKGQLGLNDLPEGTKNQNNEKIQYVGARYYPTLLERTRNNEQLPIFRQIECGYCNSFGLDIDGNVWCWGGGALGVKDKFLQRCPTMIKDSGQQSQSRKYCKIFANQNSLVLFSPLQLEFFKPSIVSTSGNNELTLFGYGFVDTAQQCIRYLHNDSIVCEDKLMFDQNTRTYYTLTPEFSKLQQFIKIFHSGHSIELQVQVSLDGIRFYTYSNKLLVYDSKLTIQSCSPKIGSVQGHKKLELYMPIDDLTLRYVDAITVGFKNNSQKEQMNSQQKPAKNLQNWICTQGTYQNNKITCKIPSIVNFNNESPFYFVDVSLNGQQFTNKPQIFRFYHITQTKITPQSGSLQGQYEITVNGNGLFDTPSRQIKLSWSFTYNGEKHSYERGVQSEWDRKNKCFTYKMPSMLWLLGETEVTEEFKTHAVKQPVLVRLSFGSQEKVNLGKFSYNLPPPPEQPQQQKKDSKKDAKKGGKK